MAIRIRPLRQDDIFNARYVVGGALSPDGASAVYVLSETVGGGAEERQATSLWQVSTRGGRERRLTGQVGDDANPQFAPDGKSVFFLSTRSNTQQVHRIPLDGGEAQSVTDLPQGVGAFALSPDGKMIVFTALAAPPQPSGPNDHVRITRSAYRMDGMGYLQHMGQALYRMSSRGGKPKSITGYDGVIMHVAFSPDGNKLSYLLMGAEQHDFMRGSLRVIELAGTNQQTVADDQLIIGFGWCDNKRIGFIAPPDDNLSRNFQLFVIGVDGDCAQSRTAEFDSAVGGLIQTNSPAARTPMGFVTMADGSAVFAPVAKGGDVEIHRISLVGTPSSRQVVGGARVSALLDGNDRSLLIAIQSPNTPPELALVNIESGMERMLTRHNRALQARIQWPKVTHVQANVAPGVEVEGWVLEPPHATPPYPTLLYIHGGPHGAFGCSFNADFQELVGADFAVAYCNPRGSTGYGDDFSTAIIGCWGKPEQQDFDVFLDKLVADGIADVDRLGVTGVSGGGHLSGWLIGNSERFKAAVPEQGLYNMFSMWGVSDAG